MAHYKVLTYREIMQELDITYSATKQLAYRREKEGRWQRERQNDPDAKIKFIIPNLELDNEKRRLDQRSKKRKSAKYQDQSRNRLQDQPQDLVKQTSLTSLLSDIREDLKKDFEERYVDKIKNLEADRKVLKEARDQYERDVYKTYERLVRKEEEITTLKARNVSQETKIEKLENDLKLASRPLWKKIFGLGK